MEKLREKFTQLFSAGNSRYFAPCFYCQVDSDQMKGFLIAFIGSVVMAGVFLTLWAYFKGHFKSLESSKHKVLDVEVEFDGFDTDENQKEKIKKE